MKYTRYCRSLLSTPASAVEKYDKGHRASADICVVDLEDSIPPRDKEDARRRAEEFFSIQSASATRCGIRINTVASPDGLSDLLAIRQYTVKPAIVVIPKAESARDIEVVEQALGETCPQTEFFAVVETPRGLENVKEIATASPRLRALIFGSADYSFDMGAAQSWEALFYARAQIVNSARAAHIEVVDAPLFELSELASLRHQATLARDLGFSGKLAVHPNQIPVINEVFSPDAHTLEQARKVVAAGRDNAHRITVVDGVMMGSPFFEASQRLVEEFGSASNSVSPATATEREAT